MAWNYQAQRGEQWLTIGNFQTNFQTDTQTDTVLVVEGDTEAHYLYGVYYYIESVYTLECLIHRVQEQAMHGAGRSGLRRFETQGV